MDTTIIYKVKKQRSKTLIITEEYIDLQEYIKLHLHEVGLRIIERNIPITFFISTGLIIFDAHLRLASTPIDIKKIKNYKGINPIILIAPPHFRNFNAFNQIRNVFKIIDLSETEE